MKRLCLAILLILLAVPLPSPAPACSICNGLLLKKQTFRNEIKSAKAVLYGKLANEKLGGGNGIPGFGTTELHIEKVLKSHPSLGDTKMVVLPKYVPILDRKDPPRYVIFFDEFKGKLDFYDGRLAQTPDLIDYVQGVLQMDKVSNLQALAYFYKYLDHADPEIATDAFLEFAKADDRDIGMIASQLPADKFRKLLLDPNTPAERLGVYAFILGAKQDPKDAELFRSMIEKPTPRTAGVEGLLCGYIQLQPKAGWDLVYSILSQSKGFNDRYAAFRVLRFYYNWDPKTFGPGVMHGMTLMLHGDQADYAIEALRRWEVWELTPAVLGLWGKKGFTSPIVSRAIVRYAVSCPQAETQGFVAKLAQSDPKLLQEIRDSLEFEKKLK